ncbi:MAG: low temperature requirement protein A [Acidimicrobiales bacterium]|nr:low temperature requirement protein A [Acidimicrobiales bacterium]
MRGITVPDLGEDFTADPSELYFDLAFVFAFSQLVGVLVHDHNWQAVGRTALLFTLMWVAWSQFTWSANAVPGNQRIVRLVFLIATAASVPMGASIGTAFEGGGVLFSLSLAVIFLMGLALYVLNVKDQPEVFRSVLSYGGVAAASFVPLVVGGFFEGGLRLALWLSSLGIFVIALVVAGGGDFLVRSGHFAERHGLIIIVALGEVIVAVGLPVVDALEEGEGLGGRTLLALLSAATFAGLLWWSYFDLPQPSFEHRSEQLGLRSKGRFSRDVYTLWHLPVVAGVILAAAGLEEITLHPSEPADLSYRLMLLGGLVLFHLGVAGAVLRAHSVIAVERGVVVLAVAAVLLLGGSANAITLLVVVDVLLLVMLVVEAKRVRAVRRASAAQ